MKGTNHLERNRELRRLMELREAARQTFVIASKKFGEADAELVRFLNRPEEDKAGAAKEAKP